MTSSKILKQAKLAKDASIRISSLNSKIKNNALKNIVSTIQKNKELIQKENNKDIKEAKRTKISDALIKRLKLDDSKIHELLSGIKSLARMPDPVGRILLKTQLDKGLILSKVSAPIGVIGMVFESRPDALVQIATLCLKSGNAVILKGGKEAKNSNKILTKIISQAIEKASVQFNNSIQLIESREDVKRMLKFDDCIDLIIPRGSNKFVRFVQENTKIPVLGHSDGICHAYIDKKADIKKAVAVCLDAKIQYTAACNAIETLLVHKDISKKFIPMITEVFKKNNVKIKIGKSATEKDWSTEYNDMIISIKVVDNIDKAIQHINKYGSRHTDTIITEDKNAARKFVKLVDSSSVMVNCSTRFADGFRYGFGAEVGISTSKIHARGPVGLEGLLIYKYILEGNGQIVETYSGKKPKPFIHKQII